ncbi:unnamed protein product [Ostreobium quekettii]|uniref:UV-endonuclease UvdE n=1 Tax=Ostreobium quekettii TaxID=121088 RepID=A0A8S1IRT2_9CHLO|nr:unnamed protein product [Ostreobium quekettii]|eukprot:evm.model.scf_35.24 EVM.evm.TU.scf_35.24   scf_35:188975-190893(+)
MKRGTRAPAHMPTAESVRSHTEMIRLGLCCTFKEVPIKFRQTTVKNVRRLEEPLSFISKLILANSESLIQSIQYCRCNNVGSFRVNSQFCPLFTHPEFGYSLTDLPEHEAILANLQESRRLSQKHDIRLVMHPDQFVVLNSLDGEIVERSILELEYHQMLAKIIGVDVINIHCGGVYGNKKAALERFATAFQRLSPELKANLTLENDDKSYTPSDLLPLCRELGIPLVYDVHHHRCNPDSMSIKEATDEAMKTWQREPLFHISSPKDGWNGPKPLRHHDYICESDFPEYWQEMEGGRFTVEVEAKAKELAVQRLMAWLKDQGVQLWKQPPGICEENGSLPQHALKLFSDEFADDAETAA